MAHTVKCNALSVYIYNFCLENSSPTPTMHTTYLQSANFAVLGQVGKNKTSPHLVNGVKNLRRPTS